MLLPLYLLIQAASLDVPVSLSVEEQSRYGVEETVLEAASIPETLPAFVQAIDAGPLAALQADLTAASAISDASSREYQRLLSLANQDQSASRAAVERALSAAAGDAARVDLLQRRLALEWGPALAQMDAVDRSDLLDQLALGEAALLRADSLQAPAGVVGSVTVYMDDGQSVQAEPLGFASTASAQLQTVGLYAVLRGESALAMRPGRTLGGTIDTGEVLDGVLIPRDAIVRLDGDAWAYVQTGPDAFARRQISSPGFVADGWLVTHSFVPGERVVTSGAGALLAVERADELAEAD